MIPDASVLYIALIGFVTIAILFALELRRWKHVGDLIGRRQRILRTILIVLIELLFIMILAGPWLMARRSPVAQLIYWTVSIFIGLAVVVIAFADLRAVTKGYAAVTRQMLNELKQDDNKNND